MIKYKFGEKLRTVRERKGITLKAVAGSIGVSESLISQIERNKVSPSIDTLMTIAETLEIDLEYLFRDFKQNKAVSIVRKGEGHTLKLGAVSYRRLWEEGTSGDALQGEVLLLEIKQGGEKGDLEYGHPGKEFGFILQGSCELKYGTEVYELVTGDSVGFTSAIPHILRNNGNETLKAVWIITPPRIFIRRDHG